MGNLWWLSWTGSEKTCIGFAALKCPEVTGRTVSLNGGSTFDIKRGQKEKDGGKQRNKASLLVVQHSSSAQKRADYRRRSHAESDDSPSHVRIIGLVFSSNHIS